MRWPYILPAKLPLSTYFMVCSQVIASSNYSLHRSELGPLTASPACLTSHPYTMGPFTASPACLTPHPSTVGPPHSLPNLHHTSPLHVGANCASFWLLVYLSIYLGRFSLARRSSCFRRWCAGIIGVLYHATPKPVFLFDRSWPYAAGVDSYFLSKRPFTFSLHPLSRVPLVPKLPPSLQEVTFLSVKTVQTHLRPSPVAP